MRCAGSDGLGAGVAGAPGGVRARVPLRGPQRDPVRILAQLRLLAHSPISGLSFGALPVFPSSENESGRFGRVLSLEVEVLVYVAIMCSGFSCLCAEFGELSLLFAKLALYRAMQVTTMSTMSLKRCYTQDTTELSRILSMA